MSDFIFSSSTFRILLGFFLHRIQAAGICSHKPGSQSLIELIKIAFKSFLSGPHKVLKQWKTSLHNVDTRSKSTVAQSKCSWPFFLACDDLKLRFYLLLNSVYDRMNVYLTCQYLKPNLNGYLRPGEEKWRGTWDTHRKIFHALSTKFSIRCLQFTV